MVEANDLIEFGRVSRDLQPDDPMLHYFKLYYTMRGLSEQKKQRYKAQAALRILQNIQGARALNVSKIRHVSTDNLIKLDVAATLLHEAMQSAGLIDNYTDKNGR